MNLKPTTVNDIPGIRNGFTHALMCFINSGNEAAELIVEDDVTAAYSAIRSAIWRKKLQNTVGVLIRGDRIFLVRKDMTK